jgi:hypothetical protein
MYEKCFARTRCSKSPYPNWTSTHSCHDTFIIGQKWFIKYAGSHQELYPLLTTGWSIQKEEEVDRMPFRASHYVAIIADMVRSRDLPPAKRSAVQKDFQKLVATLNREYGESLAAKFVITLGDEFQGLLTRAEIIPDLTWRFEENFPERELRVGVGMGPLSTAIQPFAINIDGPVLHAARAAIEKAKKDHTLGPVFYGFGQLDELLTQVASLLSFHRTRWTASQRNIIGMSRKGMTRVEITRRLKVTHQVVSKHALASGWLQYLGAENALREILRLYADPLLSGRASTLSTLRLPNL